MIRLDRERLFPSPPCRTMPTPQRHVSDRTQNVACSSFWGPKGDLDSVSAMLIPLPILHRHRKDFAFVEKNSAALHRSVQCFLGQRSPIQTGAICQTNLASGSQDSLGSDRKGDIAHRNANQALCDMAAAALKDQRVINPMMLDVVLLGAVRDCHRY